MGSTWNFAFLAYEPRHPLLQYAAAGVVRKVLSQARAMRLGLPGRCYSPVSCVRQHGQSAPLGSAPARLLCLLRARLAALGCVHSRWGHGQAATDSGSRKNSLQSYRFHCLCPPRHRHLARACLSAWPQCPSLIRLVPHVGSCDSSRLPHGVPGSSDWLGASQKEAGQLSALPLPRLLEL